LLAVAIFTKLGKNLTPKWHFYLFKKVLDEEFHASGSELLMILVLKEVPVEVVEHFVNHTREQSEVVPLLYKT
jgi:hypothetical protein